MSRQCTIGVEIEVIAEPHNPRSDLDSRAYYLQYKNELVQALGSKGLQARSWNGGNRKAPEHYDKWWITYDGSVSRSLWKWPGSVAFEAASPIMSSRYGWERQVDGFWDAYSAVFTSPKREIACGSHVHIRLPNGFSLSQLKSISYGIIFFRDQVSNMMPKERRKNEYCKQNWDRAGHFGSYNTENVKNALRWIKAENKTSGLVALMQGTSTSARNALWNFQNLEGGTGTLEFRGGRGLRGRYRTKRWIAWAVGFIFFCLETPQDQMYYTTPDLYRRIRNMASNLGMGHHLPNDYRQLNETRSATSYDAESDSGESFNSSDGENISILSAEGKDRKPDCCS